MNTRELANLGAGTPGCLAGSTWRSSHASLGPLHMLCLLSEMLLSLHIGTGPALRSQFRHHCQTPTQYSYMPRDPQTYGRTHLNTQLYFVVQDPSFLINGGPQRAPQQLAQWPGR